VGIERGAQSLQMQMAVHASELLLRLGLSAGAAMLTPEI
jgi:hypothetical protein